MDAYDWNKIRRYMPNADQDFKHVYIVDEITSTNDWVADAITNKVCPIVCVAETQTSGRGRNGRTWQSVSGESITLSVGWPLNAVPSSLGGFSLVMGLVVAQTLSKYSINAGVKWPNDVLVAGRKIAGILIEAKHRAFAPLITIVGIGINFRMSKTRQYTVEQPITDIFSECSAMVPSRNEVVGNLLNQMIGAILQYEKFGLDAFLEDWKKYDVCFGKEIRVMENERRYDAVAMGIASDGALRIRIENSERLLYASDVSIRVG